MTAVKCCAAGEAAGLRVPALGRNTARQPHWAAYNLLFHSALPPFEGRKAHTRELPAQVLPPAPRWTYTKFCRRHGICVTSAPCRVSRCQGTGGCPSS